MQLFFNTRDTKDTKAERLLLHVTVPRPCALSWDSMSGTHKVRVCAGCDREVYNLSVRKKENAKL
jgi:hypothetical protein